MDRLKQVNIIGRGKGWETAPLDEYSWGITLTNLNRKVDLAIDMNVYEDGRWGESERLAYHKSRSMAAQEGIPYIDLATYPIDIISSHFQIDYFTGTVDYALALAIYQGYSAISLYGVNATVGTDYMYQKPGIEFWLGMAMGRGIKVKVHSDHGTILKARAWQLYGYDTPQKYL